MTYGMKKSEKKTKKNLAVSEQKDYPTDMKNPHRAKLFILENCNWIDSIEHNPNAISPCNRWKAYNNTAYTDGRKVEVYSWTDKQIVAFARGLKK